MTLDEYKLLVLAQRKQQQELAKQATKQIHNATKRGDKKC
jgi:hypothetical protein